LLETSGISRANPYHVVPQGKVNALVLMKDTGRLDMLKDIAGISTYDERRSESLKMMEDTLEKQLKVSDSLKYIGTRLHELQHEKEELM
jgi:structural maintenance of chromosome 3 (chondroitin sulfate proteoglycan 6)